MSKKRGIYRLFDTNTKSYISVIGGVIRYDKKITYNSAFVYDLQDALLIKQTISRTYKKYQKKKIFQITVRSSLFLSLCR